MSMNGDPLTAVYDSQLWQRSGEGDREAFGRIVERYQSLICSLAYSACGNLGASEDLAQETFLAAWRKLGELREPARLRAWLCGIVRNLAASEGAASRDGVELPNHWTRCATSPGRMPIRQFARSPRKKRTCF